jgi:hypothetical protein
MIQAFHLSEATGRAENEDAFAIRLLCESPECYIGAVADGQGGSAGGALAARIACETCMEAASKYSVVELDHPGTWVKIAQTADAAVADDCAAGFSTLVAFCVAGSSVCGCSAGDSAAALVTGSQPGVVLTARQHKNPPVGSRAAVFVSFAAALVRAWRFLAMSDGVWKYAGWENILGIGSKSRGDEIIRLIRDRAKMPGSGGLQDDFTLVVLANDS